MTADPKVRSLRLPLIVVGEEPEMAILDAKLNVLAGMEFETDAAHIVRCVNAHDGLVEALELILHSFDDGPPSMQAVRLDDACKNAQAVLAALAAAKEGA